MRKVSKVFLFWELLIREFKGFAADFAELELLEECDKYLLNPKKNRKDFIDYMETYFGMGENILKKVEKQLPKDIKHFEELIH